MMEAAPTSETLVYIQLRTRQYIPEESELHTGRRENLKFHIKECIWCACCYSCCHGKAVEGFKPYGIIFMNVWLVQEPG
jgi:succinate dehydrogenase/fumarate reductase-like Fe-S protein